MRIVINLVLVLIIAALAYLLIDSIREPIQFQSEREKRESAVEFKLEQIRTAQESFRDITGEFAPTFDTLQQVLRNENFAIVSIVGDIDNDEEITYDTLFVPAADSISKLGIVLDSLPYIPYTNGERFDIRADTMTYQAILVHVTQVSTTRDKFMGKFADPRYKRYDDTYDPTGVIKFGDMSKPSLAGNW
jgi:type II secretory pathway pseudopilin PulG